MQSWLPSRSFRSEAESSSFGSQKGTAVFCCVFGHDLPPQMFPNVFVVVQVFCGIMTVESAFARPVPPA